jgi:phosphoglycerate dehydrogenase-like enzyme
VCSGARGHRLPRCAAGAAAPRPSCRGGDRLSWCGQLDEFLSAATRWSAWLPLTRNSARFLNAALFAKLPHGAHLINVGRGDHLVEADLLPALNAGQLSAATLDAFSQEPLPANHPFWATHAS